MDNSKLHPRDIPPDYSTTDAIPSFDKMEKIKKEATYKQMQDLIRGLGITKWKERWGIALKYEREKRETEGSRAITARSVLAPSIPLYVII